MARISDYFGRGITAMCFAVVLTGSAVSASAQGRDERCRDYARDAVEQAEQNVRERCGFQGPRWSSDRTPHYAWCLLSPRQAEDENRARAEDLRKCAADRRGGGGNREGKRANCDTYAKIAGVQTEANDKYRCGYRGGEWSSSTRGHFEWCMTNKREFAQDEMRYRAQELQKCFNNLGDYDDDRYDRGYRRRF